MDSSKRLCINKLFLWERNLQTILKTNPKDEKTKETLLRVQKLKERALCLYFNGKEKIE